MTFTKNGKEGFFTLNDGESVEQCVERAKLTLQPDDQITDVATTIDEFNRISKRIFQR